MVSTIQDSTRVQKTDTFIIFSFFCSLSRVLKIVSSLLFFYVTMNIYFYFYVNIAREGRDVVTGLLMFVDICQLNFTRTYRQTHTSTYV